MPTPLYLCLHLRDFAAQALACLEPVAQPRGLVVLSGEPPLERVFAMTQSARQLGLEEGMSRLEAESFAVAIVRRNRRQEELSFTQLMRCGEGFSPRVEAVAAPGERHTGATLVLDAAGSERLLGSAAEIGQSFWRQVSALGYEASVASSVRASTALLAARGRLGVTTIAAGDEATALAPLPLSVLEPDIVTAQTFESWGIHTLRQLAELPRRSLAARLGQNGLRLQSLARGECDQLLVPTEEPVDAPLTESMELEHPVELLEPLLFLLSQMLEKLLQRAAERALALAAVESCLALDGPSHVERREHCRLVRPTLPERERLTLLKLIQLDLETHPPAAAVIALRLTAYPARAQTAQQGLFAAQAPEAGRMEILLARLRKLVGEGRVGSAQLLDSHAPEAFRVDDFALVPPPVRTIAGARSPSTAMALRMVRPPRAVEVELRNDAPCAMHYEGRRLLLSAVSGPWRASGAWWTNPCWCREEWDVQLEEESRRCLRLARDPAAGNTRPGCAARAAAPAAGAGWYLIAFYD